MNRIWVFGLWLILGLVLVFVDKEMMLKVINSSLSYTEAGLLSGIILGEKNGIPKDFYEALINSGLIHVVVVSGSNVMLLVGGVIEILASFLGRRWAIVFGFLMGWKYVVVVGWEIPVVRAMLMLSVFYLAQLMGRKYNLVRGLVLVVLIMFIGEPKVMTSVSFWLSIVAFLGVVTTRDILVLKPKGFVRNKWAYFYRDLLRDVSKSFVDTVWISIWITPILALIFGKINLVAPLTNMLVLGLVAVVSVVGMVGTLVGVVWLAVGKIILWLTIPTLSYLRSVVVFGGMFDVLEVQFNWWILVGYYLILGYWLMRKQRECK